MRISDWSSDVCSSDLIGGFGRLVQREQPVAAHLDEPVKPGGEPDDHRTLEREQRVRRRRFGDDRDIRGLETAVREIDARRGFRSEEHTSEIQSLMRISYDVFRLKKTQ